MIDQSVIPKQGIRQFLKGVLHSGVAANLESNRMTSKYNNGIILYPFLLQPQSVLKSSLSIFDENISPNISAASKPVQKVRIRSKNLNNQDLGVFHNTLADGESNRMTPKHNNGHPMRTPLSRMDERVPPDISLRSSRGPSSFNTTNIKSTFEKGESSRRKNLMNEFNDVDDNVTIDSDTTCRDMASDIEDIDEEYLSNNQSMWDRYLDLGAPDKLCSKCDAVMWNHEKNNKSSPTKPPTFSLCCKNGQVILDKEKQPPEPLGTLLTGGVHFKHFKQNIRFYNCMFAMSSTGGKIDHSINRGCAPYCFKVQGVNCHNIGSLVPTDYNTPKICQLYIYDTEDEINNRINTVNGGRVAVNEEIVQSLLHMLDEHNRTQIKIIIAHRRLIADGGKVRRPVKLSKRDVVVTESEDLDEKGLTPHLGGRLWQQYVVDAFTAIEQYILDWIRDHQTTIRSDLYHNIKDAMQRGDKNPSNIGHPSLFLTMTTNTKWPEIQRMLKHMPGVDVADAPDVVARVFKMKVDQLMNMIRKKNCFGRCIGVMHVIEFQKRELPHTHILIWLHPDDKPKIIEQIDKMVSVEIPDPEIDLVGYNVVSNYMIHEPCGPDYTKSPCMVKDNCIKHFPKLKKGSRSFEDLKTVNGHIHETFKEAYAALGLLQNDNQWHEAIAENSHTSLPPQLRAMFVNILAYSPISDPLRLWEANWQYEDLKNYVLAEIEKLFNDIGKSLKDYATMPFPSEVYFSNAVNRLLQEETSYDKEELKILHEKNHGMLNSEQKNVYDSIIQNIYNKDSTAGIRHGTDIAELIQQTDLIIWDEAPIQHRHAFESVDRSLRDIMSAIDKRRAKKPFGGITVVFGGDYRSRAILTPTNVVVDDINNSILEKILGILHTYLSQDSIDDAGDKDNEFRSAFPVEYLNSLNMPCIPKHELNIKGQLLDTIGLYLPRAVFSHGYVYVAISRVIRPEGLHILIDSDDDMQDHHHLSNLDGNHTAWTLKVRVTRMWVSTNRQGVLVRHNLILLDCENNHILAIVPLALWNLFSFIIHPGTLLRIRNVQVLPAAGFLRPVRSTNYIMFLPITVVVLEPEEILSIPRHKFDLVPVTLLYNSLHCSTLDELPIYSTGIAY
ncbi:hypothetical protein AgCh_039840 [Apium graveolens]